MTGASYFEMGGQVIELKADYDYATGKSTAQQRNVQRKMAKDVRIIEEVPRVINSSAADDGMGTLRRLVIMLVLAPALCSAWQHFQ